MTPFSLEVSRLQWLSAHTFEVCFERPPDFDFTPGQKIRLDYHGVRREYTLVNAPQDPVLLICVRHVAHGRFSPVLAKAQKGDRFQASSAFGYFVCQPSLSPAVFVATGTGVAPFVSFARNGVGGFHLLHGVRTAKELYYHEILRKAAENYTPCLSEKKTMGPSGLHSFQGHVTNYLEHMLPKGIYDFYLCGRTEMIADATRIIDEQFEGSKVFVETFY